MLSRLSNLLQKGEKVAQSASSKPGSPPSMFPPMADAALYAEWKSQSLAAIESIVGRDHVYAQQFRDSVDGLLRSNVKSGQGVLRALHEDVSRGYLSDIRLLMTAEVFTDFLDMAAHLIETGYIYPAASLIGAVLEDGLRRIAASHEITIKSRDDVGSLNQRCADKNVYNRLKQSQVQVWNNVRNAADHGNFSEFTAHDVAAMLTGVRDFLAVYLQ